MDWLVEQQLRYEQVFLLVAARLAGLCWAAPVFGSIAVPVRVRMLLVLMLGLILTPGEAARAQLAETLPAFLLQATREGLVGFALGLGVSLVLLAAAVGGQAISQLGGLRLGEDLHEELGASLPAGARLLHLTALAVFLAIGGHELVMAGLLESFTVLPAGTAVVDRSLVEAVAALIMQSLSLGVRIAVPGCAALVTALMALGLLGRAVPQLGAMQLGFGPTSVVAIISLAVAAGSLSWLIGDHLTPSLMTVLNSSTGG